MTMARAVPVALLDIIGSARCDIIKDQLLSHTATKQRYDDILKHLALGVEHLIILRKRHGVPCCPNACRNDRDRIDRIHIRKHMEQDRMSRLMIGCDLLFFVRNNLTSFLCADTDLDKGMLDILLCNVGSASAFAAIIAASFMRFSRSAPVKPAVVCAICARSTSSPSGLSLT